MANNRIYIRCRSCGEVLFLGKCFGREYYTSNDYYKNGSLLNSLNDFYEEHVFCIKDKINDFYEPKLNETEVKNFENQFDLCYESFEK